MSKRKYNEVKELLCDELDEYGKKAELTKEKLHEIYEITSSIVMLKSLIEDEEREESGQSFGMHWANTRVPMPSNSFMRGRDAQTGRYMSRDNDPSMSYEGTMSRHSAEQAVIEQLQNILATTQDMRIRKSITQAIEKIEG